MLEGRLPSGPGPPAMNFASSGEPSKRRGVWQSAQCAAPPARYRPRSRPSRGATFGETGTVKGGTGILRDRAGTVDLKIGRASCRERVEIAVVGGALGEANRKEHAKRIRTVE